MNRNIHLWDGTQEEFSGDFLLIPRYLVEDFKLFYAENILSGVNLDKVYIIAESALDDCDIKLISETITGDDFSIDVLNSYPSLVAEYRFDILNEKLRITPKETTLIAKLMESFKEKFYLLNDLKNNLLINAPIDEGGIWLNDSFSFSDYYSKESSFNYLKRCIITERLLENLQALKKVSEDYNQGKPYLKLAILTSWYLLLAEQSTSQKDYTKSIIILHRGLETCLKSWLIHDNEISFNNKGETVGDKNTYLLDYLKLVKKNAAVTDEETEMFSSINKLRNSCKYAHGFTTISEQTFNANYNKAKKYLLNDEYVRFYFEELKKVFKIDSVGKLIFEYLKSNFYIDSYSN
ncbi:hypothetical protein CWC05_09865 [Pseudoalteromonas ruthenica]|uniref:Uncharacterized protein n=1 Tax=Pseudoalteromonas ruthenica TaxID=151081 RepID=A0A5S3Z3D2_9GAMM|nr:hypothetical protein [Pseudoalteromonas ruthenica]TMP86779.1 hypothetical protein CWC05_09865 [Pseudoalteromonas ruthenica]